MKDWATNEIELAIKKETAQEDYMNDYIIMCYKSALKAFNELCGEGHSGMSIQITKSILCRLIDGKPLTAIEDTPDSWHLVSSDSNGEKSYQHERYSSLFKREKQDGSVSFTDYNRAVGKNVDFGESAPMYSSGMLNNIVDEMYPITFPYFPSDKPYVFITDECENGKNIISITTPTGETKEINRFYDYSKTE